MDVMKTLFERQINRTQRVKITKEDTPVVWWRKIIVPSRICFFQNNCFIKEIMNKRKKQAKSFILPQYLEISTKWELWFFFLHSDSAFSLSFILSHTHFSKLMSPPPSGLQTPPPVCFSPSNQQPTRPPQPQLYSFTSHCRPTASAVGRGGLGWSVKMCRLGLAC